MGLKAITAAAMLLFVCRLSSADEIKASSLEEWDRALSNFRERIWVVYDGAHVVLQDGRGRSPAQDLADSVMTAEPRARIMAVHAQAQMQKDEGNDVAEAATLAAGSALLTQQFTALYRVSSYWEGRWRIQKSSELWERLLPRVAAADAQNSRVKMQALDAQLLQQMTAGADALSLWKLVRAELTGYDEERHLLISIINNGMAADDIVSSRSRLTPCLPTELDAAEVSADRSVQMASKPDVLNYYPEHERGESVSGRVILRVHIQADGCADPIDVYRSSGAPALDDAAVRVAEYTRFKPAVSHGSAVASAPRLPILFELQNAPPPAPGTSTDQ